MKNLILLPILFLLCSCTAKINNFSFDPEADEGSLTLFIIKSEGFDLESLTDQKADGTLDLDTPLDKLTF